MSTKTATPVAQTPMEQVLELERLRVEKGLKKGEVCAEAGFPNSTYSYILERGLKGREISNEHMTAFLAAIRSLPARGSKPSKSRRTR